MEKWAVSEAIKGKFKVKSELPLLHCSLGVIDFRTITLEQAEALVGTGSSYIEKLKESK